MRPSPGQTKIPIRRVPPARSRAAPPILLGLAIVVLAIRPWAAAGAAPSPTLLSLLERMQQGFDRGDFTAVMADPRYSSNRSEAARLSVVSQLLGYAELYSASPSPHVRERIAARADFLLAHFDEIRSGTAFDGMLALALLRAYEVTEDAACRSRAEILVSQLKQLTGFRTTLNWGLMSAMALAEYAALSGDPVARDKALEIVASLPTYQHPNGSFPHYCPGSIDMHYSAFMALELLTLRRRLPSAEIDRLLEGLVAFVRWRVDERGETDYVDECPQRPACAAYYFGSASGCPQDYDTRGWVNEAAYIAALFDHFGDPKYDAVMRFLLSLERGGAFPDKWAYFALPSDASYPWASADSSVIRTSVIFWSLATIVGTSTPAAPTRLVAREIRAPATRPVEAVPGTVVASAELAPRAPDADAVPASAARWRWTTVDSLAIAGVDPGGATPQGPSSWRGETGTRAHGALAAIACPCPDGQAPPGAPRSLAVGRTFPNPSRGPVLVRLSLAVPVRVEVAIFDVRGRRVRTLLEGLQPAGDLEVGWDRRANDGRALQPGLFFLRVGSPEVLAWRKIVLL